MTTATKSRHRNASFRKAQDAASAHSPHDLTETTRGTTRGEGSPLRVDKEAGIIFGVRVLGRTSPNCHGIRGVTDGTEYAAGAMRGSLGLYENSTIYCDHMRTGNGERSVRDTFGVLRNMRMGEDGQCTRGDLHYMKTNTMAPLVVEDVERGMGVFGLSHSVRAARGKIVGGRYVVEEIAEVRSVDLVDRPATNKNLWESRAVTKTFGEILEGHLATLNKTTQAARLAIGQKLLEEEGMPMDAPVEATPESPEDALKAGFQAACYAVIDDDSLDVPGKLAKLKELFNSREKLLAKKEPEAESGSGSSEKPADDAKPKESLEAKFRKLEAKDACRDLCESLNVKPTAVLLESLAALDTEDKRKALLAGYHGSAEDAGTGGKGKPAGNTKPRSTGPGGRKLNEATEPKDAKDFAASITE